MSEPKSRALDPGEQRVMSMVNTWNRLADDGRLVGTLIMSVESFDVLVRYSVARHFRTEDVGEGKVRVFFWLVELEKYLRFACRTAGLTLLVNGGCRTHDGFFIEPAPGRGEKGGPQP